MAVTDYADVPEPPEGHQTVFAICESCSEEQRLTLPNGTAISVEQPCANCGEVGTLTELDRQ